MIELVHRVDEFATQWAEAMSHAALWGAVAIFAAWLALKLFPRIPAWARPWIWRLAYLKLLVALFWATPLELPLLPAGEKNAPPSAQRAPTDSRRSPALADSGVSADPSPGPGLRNVELETVGLSAEAWLLAAWFAGIAGGSATIVRNWFAVSKLRRSARVADDAVILNLVAELSLRLGRRRCPPVLIHEGDVSPQLVGLVRPAIVLPPRLLASESAMEARIVLAHELAHWRRRDLWWNWLLAAAHVLFFFHPAVWLARREWRLAHEIACDELAIRITRVRPTDYSNMILDFLRPGHATLQPSYFSVGLSHSFRTMTRRIIAMQSIAPNSPLFSRTVGFVLLLIAPIALIPWKLTAQESPATPTGRLKLVAKSGQSPSSDDASKDAEQLPSSESWQDVSTSEQLEGRIILEGALGPLGDEDASQSRQNLIISVDPNTGEWHAIAKGGHSVRVSPDGSTIAYEQSAINPDAGVAPDDHIWTCNIGDGAARPVAQVGGRPVWSPDGRELVASEGSINEEDETEMPEKPVWEVVTWKFSRDGGEKKKLPIPSSDFVEDWSPDGEWFVTSSDRHAPYGSGYQLYLMRTDGTDQRRLTKGGLNVFARFSPDGKRVLFLHQEKGQNSIRSIELASGKETVLFKNRGLTFVAFACWSPSGEHLAIILQQWQLDDEGQKILSADSANPRLAILKVGADRFREVRLRNAEVLWLGHSDWK